MPKTSGVESMEDLEGIEKAFEKLQADIDEVARAASDVASDCRRCMDAIKGAEKKMIEVRDQRDQAVDAGDEPQRLKAMETIQKSRERRDEAIIKLKKLIENKFSIISYKRKDLFERAAALALVARGVANKFIEIADAAYKLRGQTQGTGDSLNRVRESAEELLRPYQVSLEKRS